MSLGKGLEGFDLDAVLAGWGGSDDHKLRSLVAELDHDRLLIAYVRKSNPTGHERSAHYLRGQELMPSRIIKCGFPKERVLVKDGDTGKSGALPRQFRSDLDSTFHLMGEGLVGTIMSVDVARWFRDPSLKGPAEFVQRAGRNKVKLLTHIKGKLILLDFNDKKDRETFFDEAQVAADHRDKIREVTNSAKRTSASEGNFTGGPAPLGWRVEPGKLKLESDTREAVAPQLVVYPPHSEVKLKIMRAAMLPHIKSYRALRRHLIEQDIIVPPFAEEFRTQSYRRSVLRQVFTTTPAGRVYLRPDESLVPSTTMLKPILLDPLAIGVKLYGSGEGGVYALRRHFKFAEKSDVVPDCQILPVKVCMGTFPELAICRTNEEVTLYRDVCRKWARVDLDIQWEVNHRTDLLTPNPGQSAGRPSGPPRGSSRANPWAGYVLCGRHGMDKDCAPIVARHLRLSAATGNWQCTTEYNKQETDRTCSNWGDNNILGRVLDTHLLRSIEYALQNDAAIIQCVATGESATARKARVAAELREVKDAYDDAMAAYTQLQRMWKEIDPASVDAETKDYFARNVKPLALVYSDKKKEVEKLGTADGVPSVGTEQEITDALRFAIANWDKLSVDRKSHVIGLLVSHVTVQVTNGAESREGVVYFTWRNGWTDRIVSWRGWFLDDRPWSEEEDATLEELWKSDCSWQEIANRLQPHRRFNRTHRRAMHLGVARNAGRSSQWIQAGRDSERTWHDDNPDVLYLILEPGNDPRECLGVWSREKSAVMAIPETVLHGLQVTISACASRRSGS